MDGNRSKAIAIALCCCLVSCVKDKPGPQALSVPGSNRKVYVVCEGNFGNGDATLYLYEPGKASVYGDIYKTANNQPLGDVFQSMVRIGDKFFLCVNNSDKVVVTDTLNGKIVATLAIPKPRYILPVSASKAYVSTLYSNKVYIINPETFIVTDTIGLPGMNAEGMCRYGNTAIVCTWDTASNTIVRLDTRTDKIAGTMQVAGYAPQEALLDKEGMLWVLGGNQPKGRQATLTRLDTLTGEVLRSYQFPAGADAIKPVFNLTKDTLYFIEVNYKGGISNNGIYRMSIQDVVLPETPFVQARPYQYFWALGTDPACGQIYIGDPKGFTQKGTVYVLQQNGIKVDSFGVGLGPGHFYFE